ncbi:cell division suppressor protein YneA [Sporosarcina sp. CAU 1771]
MTFIKNNSYILLIMVLCLTFSFIGTNKLNKKIDYNEVTVIEGDTLLYLATKYGEEMVTEQWIAEVKKLNDLNSTNIIAGNELKVPVFNSIDKNEIAIHLEGDDE